MGECEMNWFKRHLNWTYLLSIVFAFFMAFIVGVVSGLASLILVDKSDPLYGLHTYLDESYTRLWSATEVPDLDNLPWSASDSGGWQTATLTAYLENRGNNTLEVSVFATDDPRFVRPGFSVSSNSVGLKPNERSPIVIRVRRNLAVQSALSPDIGWEMIYYQVQPVPWDENAVVLVYSITFIAILVGSAAWVLHQKGRSYGWLLLSLSGIGIIIILCLENKRLRGHSQGVKGVSPSQYS